MTRAPAGPTTPGDDEVAMAKEALRRVKSFLGRAGSTEPTRPVTLVVEGSGEQLVVPRHAVDLLARVLAPMAAGQGVSVVPANAELTTQQAADVLNVSRPFLIGLLDAGEIEYRMVGTHRRIVAASLLEFERRDDTRRRAIADELSELSRDIGLD